MRKSEFMNLTNECETEVDGVLIKYKNSYTESEKQEIYRLCRTISRVQVPEDRSLKEPVKLEVLRPYFLRSLSIFESPLITDYFEEKTRNLKLIREKGCTSSDIKLNYKYSVGRPLSLSMIVPRRNLVFDDQIGYAHEIGHIPELVYERPNFLEYSETLPMFLEYIVALRKHKEHAEAFNHFLLGRLPLEQETARDIMKIYKNTNGNKKYQTQLIADWYSYLESLDYAIQLAERFDNDFDAVTFEIESILDGKSLIDVAKDLDIDTDSCLTLKREYKRIGRI